MNDLEICKRIAEIEGYKVSTDVRPSCGAAYVNMYPNNCYGNYNPLTDKALCFDLMVKHNIELTPMSSGCWCASSVDVYTFDGQVDYKLCPSWLDDNPQKAICLAIIKADEENKTTWLRDSNTNSNKGK